MANIEVEKVFKSETNAAIDYKNTILKLKGHSRVTINPNSSCLVSGKYSNDPVYSSPPLVIYSIECNDSDAFCVNHHLQEVTNTNFKIALQNTSKTPKDVIINYFIQPF